MPNKTYTEFAVALMANAIHNTAQHLSTHGCNDWECAGLSTYMSTPADKLPTLFAALMYAATLECASHVDNLLK